MLEEPPEEGSGGLRAGGRGGRGAPGREGLQAGRAPLFALVSSTRSAVSSAAAGPAFVAALRCAELVVSGAAVGPAPPLLLPRRSMAPCSSLYFRKRRQSSPTCVSMMPMDPCGERPRAKMFSNALKAAARRGPA